MSVEHHRERIARMVRERIETNAVATLEQLQEEIAREMRLDGSQEDRRELERLVRSLYRELERQHVFDYDDVVEQSFPASDPPPPPAPG